MVPEVPDWDWIYRAFPISFWAIGIFVLGWYLRGRVDQQFIDYLKQEKKDGNR